MLLAANQSLLVPPISRAYVSDVTTVSANQFEDAFDGDDFYTSYSFPELGSYNSSTIGTHGYYHAFSNCAAENITIGSLESGALVEGVNGSALGSNSFEEFAAINSGTSNKLKSVSFPTLTWAWGVDYVFKNGCRNQTGLISFEMPYLTHIGGRTVARKVGRRIIQVWTDFVGFFQGCFYGCTSLTTLTFPSLMYMESNDHFADNNCLQVLNFPKMKSMGNSTLSLFSGCTSLREIHFAVENQSLVEASPGYAAKWNAPSSCQIIFDLHDPSAQGE